MTDWRSVLRNDPNGTTENVELLIVRVEVELIQFDGTKKVVHIQQHRAALDRFRALSDALSTTRDALVQLNNWDRGILARYIGEPIGTHESVVYGKIQDLETHIDKWDRTLDIICRRLQDMKPYRKRGTSGKYARRCLVRDVALAYADMFDMPLRAVLLHPRFKYFLSILLAELGESATNPEQIIRQSFPALKKSPPK